MDLNIFTTEKKKTKKKLIESNQIKSWEFCIYEYIVKLLLYIYFLNVEHVETCLTADGKVSKSKSWPEGTEDHKLMDRNIRE